EKHWCPTQPSTNGSHFKELLAQFRAEFALQAFANLRVRRSHFLTCQCATSVAICQSVCKRLSRRAKIAFAAGEKVEQLDAFEKRFVYAFNQAQDFRVT